MSKMNITLNNSEIAEIAPKSDDSEPPFVVDVDTSLTIGKGESVLSGTNI